MSFRSSVILPFRFLGSPLRRQLPSAGHRTRICPRSDPTKFLGHPAMNKHPGHPGGSSRTHQCSFILQKLVLSARREGTPLVGFARRLLPNLRGTSRIWVGVCGALLETLTLFQTKICDFPYPISDLNLNLMSENLSFVIYSRFLVS